MINLFCFHFCEYRIDVLIDFVLVAVILLSQKYRLNPDNLATPLAASLGDVVSISLLSFIASFLFDNISKPFCCVPNWLRYYQLLYGFSLLETHIWITFVVVACYVVFLPLWMVVVLKNKYARPVLKSGWLPVLSALCISG